LSPKTREAIFQPEFLEDLRHWVNTDRKLALRALELVEAILRDPFQGIGKPEPDEIPGQAAAEELEPLEYMLKVMNDPTEDKELRARMAIAAAPFVHARKGEGKGKKQDREDRAMAAGKGRFASRRPPQLKVIKNA